MREKVLQYIREQELIGAGDRVAVAVSGGADSVALLRVLLELRAELGIVLAVAHFNHQLRGQDSAADEAFVAELARQHELDFFAEQGDVRAHAITGKLSLEAAARQLRYRWFQQLAGAQRFQAIATGHTQDDQAETVLLKLLRGAGTKGLAGIYPRLTPGHIVRPMLGISRAEVESYLASLGQSWREDESNRDRRFLRNRVRHELLPLLESEYNPNIRQSLGDLAEISRADEEYWQARTDRELRARRQAEGLSLEGFARLPLALQRRLLKSFAAAEDLTLDFEHIETLRRCALAERSKAALPGDRIAERVNGVLLLRAPTKESAPPYLYHLSIPGEVELSECGIRLRAIIVSEEFAADAMHEDLLRLDLLPPELIVRNWRPGDRFRPAHNRSQEKLKRLFAEKKIPTAERSTWPVVLHEERIVWVRKLGVAHEYCWKSCGQAVRIDVT